MTDNVNNAGPEIFRLGGRVFRAIDFAQRNIPNHLYLESRMRLSGLDMVIPGEGESDEAWAVRLRGKLVDSGMAVEIVAGYILPADHAERDWTPELAAETARHIRQCTAAENMETFDQLAMAVALRFFMHAAEQFARFRSFSSAKTTNPAPMTH